MTTPQQHGDDGEWTPAFSEPGEIFTPEGQIKQAGAFARGLVNKDPRVRPYRRQMWRTAFAIIGIGIALVFVMSVLAAVL